MEDETQVSKEYKDLFNLSYTLNKDPKEGAELYKSLLEVSESGPMAKDSEAFRALEAGRAQAEADFERDMDKMHKEHITSNHSKNGIDITQDKRPKQSFAEQNGLEPGNPGTPDAPTNNQSLTHQQQKELEAHEKWMTESKERQTFKETSRRMKTEGHENSEAVERGNFETNEQKEDREYIEKMQEKRKGREKGRSQ